MITYGQSRIVSSQFSLFEIAFSWTRPDVTAARIEASLIDSEKKKSKLIDTPFFFLAATSTPADGSESGCKSRFYRPYES